MPYEQDYLVSCALPQKRPLRKAGMPTWYFQRKRKHVFKQGHFFRVPLLFCYFQIYTEIKVQFI